MRRMSRRGVAPVAEEIETASMQITTYRIQSHNYDGNAGRWLRVGKLSYNTKAEAEMIADRYRREYPSHSFRVQEHKR